MKSQWQHGYFYMKREMDNFFASASQKENNTLLGDMAVSGLKESQFNVQAKAPPLLLLLLLISRKRSRRASSCLQQALGSK